MATTYVGSLAEVGRVGPLSGLARSQPQPKEVARQFDTMMVSMMLKEARISQTLTASSKLDFGLLSGFFTQHLADIVARQYNLGFGATLLGSLTQNEGDVHDR